MTTRGLLLYLDANLLLFFITIVLNVILIVCVISRRCSLNIYQTSFCLSISFYCAEALVNVVNVILRRQIWEILRRQIKRAWKVRNCWNLGYMTSSRLRCDFNKIQLWVVFSIYIRLLFGLCSLNICLEDIIKIFLRHFWFLYLLISDLLLELSAKEDFAVISIRFSLRHF